MVRTLSHLIQQERRIFLRAPVPQTGSKDKLATLGLQS
jgi:hypothetical protein